MTHASFLSLFCSVLALFTIALEVLMKTPFKVYPWLSILPNIFKLSPEAAKTSTKRNTHNTFPSFSGYFAIFLYFWSTKMENKSLPKTTWKKPCKFKKGFLMKSNRKIEFEDF